MVDMTIDLDELAPGEANKKYTGGENTSPPAAADRGGPRSGRYYWEINGGGIPDQTLIYNKIINIHTTIQRLEKQMKNLENKF